MFSMTCNGIPSYKFILTVLCTSILAFSLPGQSPDSSEIRYAPQDRYLVDKLDLASLTESDRKILESSLEKYHQARHDTSKISALNDICNEMMSDEWHKYLEFQYRLVEEALKKENDSTVSEKLKISLGAAYNNFGYIHRGKGDLPLALEYNLKSLKISEELEDKLGISASLNSIGAIYYSQDDFPLALDFYDRSLKIRAEMGDKIGMASSYNNIGAVYNKQGDTELALEYYEKGLVLREELGDKIGMCSALNNLGYVHEEMGNLATSMEYYTRGLRIQEELGNKNAMAYTLVNIAQIAYQQGNTDGPDGALALATKSLNYARETGSPGTIQYAAKLLTEIYAKQGKGLQALEMHRLFIQMRDSLVNQENVRATAKQQARYDYEKQKALDDKENEQKLELEKKEKEKQTIISYGVTAGCVLIFFFLLFVYSRLRITRTQKGIIQLQKEEVENQKLLVEEAYEELNQTNEEILAQRDQIEYQKKQVEIAHADLSKKNSQILDSINYAKRLQSTLLMNEQKLHTLFPESFVFFKPKDVVSGDFYWSFCKGDLIYFAVVDCTGHGVPGALMSLVCNRILNSILNENQWSEPGLILNQAHKNVVKELRSEFSEYIIRDGMDISLCQYNTKTMELKFAGAHNSALLFSDGKLSELKADNRPVGYTLTQDEKRDFKTSNVMLKPNDMLYLYTDGYMDQFGGEKGLKFFYQNFENLLAEIHTLSVQEQQDLLIGRFYEWKNDWEQIDDITVMGIRF